jgi:hypothetical protein
VKITRKINDAAAEVKETAGRIGESAQANTIALVAVAAVAMVALMIATTALVKVER